MKKIIMVAALALTALAATAECYSDGVRVGSVQKFSSKGFVNKSWEGELVMEGEKIAGNANGIRGGNIWAFSVLDPKVAKVIDEAVMTGGQIALKYCQVTVVQEPLWQTATNTGYRIVMAVPRK
jgi:hypothetical protein